MHIKENEFARDRDLALQLACEDRKIAEYASFSIEDAPLESFSGQKGLFEILEGKHIQDQVSFLLSSQLKSSFYRIDEGLMVLLRKCLEAERGLTCSAISGHIDHFQSTSSEDSGWGCGWRNIQMLSSHLLMQTHGAQEMLFGGSGFVPDIPSLQRWLEIAWERGFDKMGAGSFDSRIYGCKKWIGTTECAALLRSFGLRARIVDFGCEAVRNRVCSGNALSQLVQGRGRETPNIKQTSGPLDKFLHFGVQCDGCQVYPIRGLRFRSTKRENFDLCSHCMGTGKYPYVEYLKIDTASSSTFTNNSKESKAGNTGDHQVLVDWVWNYFVGKNPVCLKAPFAHLQERVITSQRTPLYFQHNGHSRTIVGIQRRRKSLLAQEEESILLVLDPGQRTEELARALRENVGWQKLIKRGSHTLRKPEYQVCYVDPGIAHGEELERLKILDSELFKY
eukprot:Gb_05546 [translate_table: standard]